MTQRLRFKAECIGDDKTAYLDGQIVTLRNDPTLKQPPVGWKMPGVFAVTSETGDDFVAFADELMIEVTK